MSLAGRLNRTQMTILLPDKAVFEWCQLTSDLLVFDRRSRRRNMMKMAFNIVYCRSSYAQLEPQPHVL